MNYMVEELKLIEKIQFGLMDPETIRKLSKVKVVTPDTYDEDGYPIEGGLMDPRMGVIDPGLRCATCGGRMDSCFGHFGHIELVRPVVHIGYVKEVYTLLKATCRKCGRLLVPPGEIERYKNLLVGEIPENAALEIIEKTKKVKTCPHCGETQENITLVKPTSFYEGDQRLYPSQIRERLERIPDEDLKLLGFDPKVARPEWMVLTVLPVPPVTVRPSITLETGERSEDDLTHKLVDILRINQRLADNISAGAPQLIIEDLWDLLQYHVTTYFNNEVAGIPSAKHRSGRPLKTLFQRLKGKEGRFRYNLSGKRVNFSARTVISPDPRISISEVGVPEEIAKELTVPEYVTDWNINEIKKLIKAGKVNYVIRPDKRRKKVTEQNKDTILEEIQPGYVVERQLMDGDIVLFNRQPSLHRVSMMAHEVRILPGKTFRLNDAVSTPYNADYDGDEMNLHVPQTEEARAEAYELMKVEKHIISIRHGKPLIKGNQDHITGAVLLTRKDTVLSRTIAEYLLSRIGIKESFTKKKISGKELFSYILPKDLNLEFKNKFCKECRTCKKEECPYEAFVKIKNGKLISGIIEADGFSKHILLEIHRKYGPSGAKDYLDKITKLSLDAITLLGYTMSVDDLELSEKAKKKIKEILDNAEKEANKLVEDYKKGKIKALPGKTPKETMEDMVMNILNTAWRECGKIAEEDLGISNQLVLATKSGARGSIININQMCAAVGPTTVRGKLISRSYRRKILPHFKEGDISVRARGFIKTPIGKGLSPIEFFFYTMGGRDSLVDKGVKTSRSGYMQRRLINALQDLTVRYDYTVRDARDGIIQFLYGEDGINPQKYYGGWDE